MKRCQPLLLSVVFFHSVVASTNYHENANIAINILQDKWYNTETGLWKSATGAGDMWWQSGNIVETLARFAQEDAGFKPAAIEIISNTYAKSPNQLGAKGWKNDYYDDMGWWALGWIAAYDLTGDKKYLDSTKDIFEDMTSGWTTPCNGGIWWDKPKTSIAAIANELFLSVAAHLANRVDDNKDYMNWAIMEWDWFYGSGIINKDHLINDGIDKGTCRNDGKWTFTYTQGVVLGGLSELARATGDNTYIDRANELATGSLAKLTDNGILTEPVTGPLDDQGSEFKGAYIRGLAALNANIHQQEYSDFLKKNADSVWEKARNPDGIIEDRWQGGSNNVKASTHASGIDVLVAAAGVS